MKSLALLKSLLLLTLLLLGVHRVKALDNGIDPANLGKGDWFYYISMATNKLGGNVLAVTDIPSLMSYERNQGMNYIIVKAGTGSTNFNGGGASPQFNSNLVYQAHLAGLKIFAYTRSYGDDVPGEIALATNCLNLGADGFVIDAESEWESGHLGTQGPAKAIQLCTGIKNVYPNKFLGHAPFPYISLHSSFPYKEFGFYCDAVMPQDYWYSIGNTPTVMVSDMSTQWRNWQNSLTGQWTNSIKPIAPIGQADNVNITAAEITEFVDALKNDSNPATIGGYKGVSWWRSDLHTSNQWTAITAGNIGNQTGVADIIVDNPAATVVGTWSTASAAVDKYGSNYRYKSQGTGAAYLQFSPNILTAGNYAVYEWHAAGSNRTTNAPCTISYNGGTTTVFVNQKVNGASWRPLGTYNFAAGTSGNIKIADNFPDSAQIVIADAVKLVYVIPPPAAPSGLVATAVAGPQINLSWTDNSSDESSFVVSRSTTSGGPYTDIATLAANTVSHTDSAVTVSTTYYYVVRAINQAGSSVNSSEASATTAAGVADIIIDNPAATVVGSWSTGTSATDKFGSDYRYKSQGTGAAYVQYAPTISTPGDYRIYEWHPQGANRSAGTPHVITYNGGTATINVNQQANGGSWNLLGTFNLVSGTSGNVKIQDNFTDGTQIALADAIKFSYVAVINPPNAPSGLSATAVSSSQINLTWVDNSTTEDNFVVSRSTTSGGPYTDIATLAANTVSYSNTGLNSSTTYYYVVRAINSGGSSAYSAQASATTQPSPAPAAPSGLTATAVSSSQINLAWTDNSSTENNFIVGRSTASGGPYTDIVTLAANTTSYNNTGLASGTTYYYVVRASNAGGSSANSAEASATTIVSAPSAPSGLSATTVSAAQINLAWTDNSSNESNFIVGRSTTSGGPFTDVATLAANTTSYNNTGLAANTTYYYAVRASNAGGSSANSAQASATTLPFPPSAPGGLTATTISSSQIDLAWTDNSPNETSFVVGRSATVGGPYTDIVTLGANAVSYSNTGLAANTVYYYVVRAVNTGGASPNSNEAAGSTLPLPPNAPSALSATTISSSQINLSWSDNSSNEDNFIVSRSTTAGGPYTDVATLAANSTSYDNTGLSANTTYYYVVRASNAGGASTGSNEAAATTLPLAPAAPSGLSASAVSSSQINLAWNDNSSNESNFIVARATASGGPYTDIATLAANTISYSNTGLTAATTYYYVVRAVNAGGSSANSAQSSATTLVGAVADIIIDNSSASMVGSWILASSATDKFGVDYRYKGQGTGSAYVQYTPTILTAGFYKLYEWHSVGANRSVGAPHVVNYNGASKTNSVNQQLNGGQWNLVGGFNFAAGSAGNVKITDAFADAGQIAIADAVKLVHVAATNVIHVNSITMSWVLSGTKYKSRAVVNVVDGNGTAVSGVTVTGNFSGAISNNGMSAVTGSAGNATITSTSSINTGTVTFTVTGITGTNLNYDHVANLVTSASKTR